MSPHDALLEELGLSPLWVRRDRGATVGVAEQAVESVAPVDAANLRTDPDSSRGAASAVEDRLPKAPAVEARSTASDAVGTPAEDIATAEARRDALNEARTQAPPAKSIEAPIEARRDALNEARTQAPSAKSIDAPAEARGEAQIESPIESPIHRSDEVPSELQVSESDIATLDFASLRTRVAGCTACGLCENRTQTVFGVGDEGADWMIVGEAPGENEDRIGEPFVGQAGKLLDNMLRAVGLDRTRSVYIANVIKCRPPGNRDPQPDEVARCEPFLKQQVALIRPKVIVALGRFAAQTLLKSDEKISSLRGHVHKYEGVPVIVTYHPAYLLRTLSDKSKAWTDLCLAQATYRKVSS